MKGKMKVLTVTVAIIFAMIMAVNVSAEPAADSQNVSVGDTIRFGEFNWLVLDVDGDYALIITEDVIFQRRFHSTRVNIDWENSDIRHYLNSDYYNQFTVEERARIRQTTFENDITDKIFLLSIEEAEGYFENNASRIALGADGVALRWLLRCPGRSNVTAAYVNTLGNTIRNGVYVDTIWFRHSGIRPALFLNLNEAEAPPADIAFVSANGNVSRNVIIPESSVPSVSVDTAVSLDGWYNQYLYFPLNGNFSTITINYGFNNDAGNESHIFVAADGVRIRPVTHYNGTVVYNVHGVTSLRIHSTHPGLPWVPRSRVIILEDMVLTR